MPPRGGGASRPPAVLSTVSDVVFLGTNRGAAAAAAATDPFLAPGVIPPSARGVEAAAAAGVGGEGGAVLTATGAIIKVDPAFLSRQSHSAAGPGTAPARYFEGVVPLSLPDDSDHLPELQCLIREQLELFSATDADASDRQYGKRVPIVRGKVGIRCVHCQRAMRDAAAAASATTTAAVASVACASSDPAIATPLPADRNTAAASDTPIATSSATNIATNDIPDVDVSVASVSSQVDTATVVAVVPEFAPSTTLDSISAEPSLYVSPFTRHEPFQQQPRQGTSSTLAAPSSDASQINQDTLRPQKGRKQAPSASSSDNRDDTPVDTEPPTDWECDMCGKKNAASISRCGKPCWRWRGGVHSMSKKSAVKQECVERWQCDQCGKMNPVTISRCGKPCYRWKGGVHPGSRQGFRQGVRAGEASPTRKSKIIVGSISYIAGIGNLSTICSQKVNQHFLGCPNLPDDVKHEFRRLTHDEDGILVRRRIGNIVTGKLGIKPTAYWQIAARRIGLVDVKSGGGGIRFGRDPRLPLRTTEEVISEDPTLVGAVRGPDTLVHNNKFATKPQSSNLTLYSMPGFGIVKTKGNEASENALAKVVAEIKAAAAASEAPGCDRFQGINNDQPAEKKPPDKGNGVDNGKTSFLVHSEDLLLATDFLFLLASQVGIVNASRLDAKLRGKRSKSVRFGAAGFNCRGCTNASNGSSYGESAQFRLFPPTPEAFCTSLTQSFLAHLQKCSFIRQEVKSALVAYKRIHSKQVSELPRGANGRYYKLLFSRLKAMDKSPEDMPPDESSQIEPLVAPPQQVSTNVESGVIRPTSFLSQVLPLTSGPISDRPNGFPRPTEEAAAILAVAMSEDSSLDDLILRSSEIMLVTDFMVLLMKQLMPCIPSNMDHKYRPTRAKAGLCCKHCAKQSRSHIPGWGPAGRAFPSAPDNYATSLKVSLFNHLIKCDCVPDQIKQSLIELKALHPQQMACLQAGAQRQYLFLLFERLNAWATHAQQIISTDRDQPYEPVDAGREVLEQTGFVEFPPGWYSCFRCRMVPFELRASGSLSRGRPDREVLKNHQKICKKAEFDSTILKSVINELILSVPGLSIEILRKPLFIAFIESLVGHRDLLSFFLSCIVDIRTSGEPSKSTNGLWACFPSSVDNEALTRSFDSLSNIEGINSGHFFDNEHFKSLVRILAPSCIDMSWMEPKTNAQNK